ncbi:MAG: glutamine-hydrolyzing carbamoyl-phosphate synthase small subunit [Candidatus Omnitrophica bacterium]|nr:glutamine-hydrolyzing carbamoyl-phosphate synthase small subunit [Candidatus Omnitrophota bacterium]
MNAVIALEDGTVFKGKSFGAAGERCAEIVFNTSMTGYQEILTDPSYKGQFVLMTYPLIGNYGINPEDVESREPFVEGFIVKECSRIASNWRSQETLREYLKKNKILGIEGIDTRALTRHIRLKGAMKAVISTVDTNEKNLVERVKASPGLIGRDLVKKVTCGQTYTWPQPPEKQFKVVVLDCGVKFNILRELAEHSCEITVVPATTKSDEILKLKPDGVLLSNGPGDPEGVSYVVETVKELIGKVPIFGICLGHQMLGLALGGRTYKLKFGHHGANHPAKNLKTGRIAITVQNHGFCVDINSLSKKDVEVTHINLNDNTCEGLKHKSLPVFSVQFHPEASAGPNDAKYLFHEFMKTMRKHSAKKNRH